MMIFDTLFVDQQLSTFKKRAREAGIARWPQRKIMGAYKDMEYAVNTLWHKHPTFAQQQWETKLNIILTAYGVRRIDDIPKDFEELHDLYDTYLGLTDPSDSD